MLAEFETILFDKCRIKPDDSLLICCSGGVDSMVLLHLVWQLQPKAGFSFAVLHVDHGLRGAASAADARFVRQWCARRSIGLHLVELRMNPDTPNLEEEARLRRYEAVDRLLAGYDHALTGHNLNDQAETVLYRLIRGTGLKGIGGMDLNGRVLRPLLGISRERIEVYAAEHAVEHIQDLSNQDLKYRRNLIRSQMLPTVEAINPQALEAIARFARIARLESQTLDELSEDLRRSSCRFDWPVAALFDAEKLLAAPRALVKRLLIDQISLLLHEPRGIDAAQVEACMDVLEGRVRAHAIKRRVRVARQGGDLLVGMSDCSYRRSGTAELFIDELGRNLMVGDADEVRSLRPGDRVGPERVVDILSRRGVPALMRPYWPLALKSGVVVEVLDVH